jgi:tetratricopeptide (TPR) repeat protein
MYKQLYFILLASMALLFSCNSKSSNSDNWKQVYQNAYTNQDYNTAVVALNHLIISDSSNRAQYYDSLAFYYIKKQRNYTAGKSIVEKGLKLSPNNYNFLEFKSIFLSADNKIDESRTMLQKAYKLSGLKKHLYMYATTFASDKNIEEYTKIVNGFLYDPSTKPEMVEVSIDDASSQMVEIKALCYMDKAKISKNPLQILAYIDSALMIEPNYQEALYFKEKLRNPSN